MRESLARLQAPPAPGEQRLIRAIEAAAPGVWDWDVATGEFLASERLRQIYGFPAGAKIELQTFLAAIHAQDISWTEELSKAHVAPTRRSFRYRIHRIDTGEIRWIKAEIEGDGSASWTGTIEDITEQVQAAHALVESEERFRLAIEAGRMAVWEVDLETGTVTNSPELNLLFGFPTDAKPSFAEFRSRYAPGEVERLATEGATLEVVRARFERGEFEPRREGAAPSDMDRTQVQAEVTIVLPGGATKRLLYRAQYAFTFDGRPRITGLLVDITDRKLAEERLAIVARELQHRVKNSLAVVYSIAFQSFRADTDLASARQNFLARLKALSTATELVLASPQSDARLAQIVGDITKPYRVAAADPFLISGEDVAVPGKVASALGLVLHELCTNAVKYGSLSSPSGRVELEWQILPNAALALNWIEQGGPPVSRPTRRGFGTKLIETLVSSDLGGVSSFAFGQDGLRCQITTGERICSLPADAG